MKFPPRPTGLDTALRRAGIGLSLIWVTATAGAHPVLENSLQVDREPAGLRLHVNASVEEICAAEVVRFNAFMVPDEAELAAAARRHGDYLLAHLTVCAGTNRLSGQVRAMVSPAEFDQAEDTFYRYELDYPCPGTLPGELTFAQSVLQERSYGPGVSWDVSYRISLVHPNNIGDGTRLLTGRKPVTVRTGWSDPASPRPTGRGNTFTEYLWHGVWHILTGYDHLLFVTALVLATRNFWGMFQVIAAFTLAHTLTLTLAVFDLVRLPSALVEPVIALSIVFVALENALRPERTRMHLRLAVAFGFGLIHGLGFAGGLLEQMTGLPAGGVWVALGGFSLGVELGHQAVVLPLFVILWLGRQRYSGAFPPGWLRAGSLTIATGGAVFLMLAIREQFFGQ